MMKRNELGGLLFVLALPMAMAMAALAEELDPADEAVLRVRAQARQVEDANEVMDGLEKLARFPEAARVLLSQSQNPALLQALRAMRRPAPLAGNPAVTPAAARKPAARTAPETPRPAAQRSPAPRVVGAWAAPTPKAIFLADGYHIVYAGDSFKVSSTTYTLRTITPLDSPEAKGERRYRVEYADHQGAVTRLVWPSP